MRPLINDLTFSTTKDAINFTAASRCRDWPSLSVSFPTPPPLSPGCYADHLLTNQPSKSPSERFRRQPRLLYVTIWQSDNIQWYRCVLSNHLRCFSIAPLLINWPQWIRHAYRKISCGKCTSVCPSACLIMSQRLNISHFFQCLVAPSVNFYRMMLCIAWSIVVICFLYVCLSITLRGIVLKRVH